MAQGQRENELYYNAGLLQQGFGQAQAGRQQDIQNRFNLGTAQQGIAGATQGLGSFQSGLAGQQAGLGAQTQALQGTDISRLGQLGALNQAQTQAGFDATREANRMAAFQPQEQLDRYASSSNRYHGWLSRSNSFNTMYLTLHHYKLH